MSLRLRRPDPSQTTNHADGSARIRVAFFCDAHELGGAEISLRHLLRLLPPRIDATVIGTDERIVNLIVAERPDTVAVVLPEIRRRRELRIIARHVAAVWRIRPDILHVSLNRPWGSRWPILAGLLTPGVRVVAVEHSPRQPRHLRHRLYTRAAARFLSAHVALGQTAADAVAAIAGVRRERITVIPIGVPDAPIEVQPRPASGPIVGCIARLDEIKGLDILLRAMPELPGVTAVVVGDGNDRQRLLDIARTEGVSNRVLFTGWSDHARDFLSIFDLFVLPSRFEAVGMSAIEAMLAARPVIATDVGGVHDVVIDGETGLLVPPENPTALATAVRTLLDDPDRMRAMGRAGRTRALEQFTDVQMAAGFAALYAQLVAPARR